MLTFICGLITCMCGGFLAGTGLARLGDDPGPALTLTFAGIIFVVLGVYFLTL